MYNYSIENWALKLQNEDPNKEISENFLSASLVKSLPLTWEPDNYRNIKAFFDFFDAYGTHFVSEVKVGGSLRYYSAIFSNQNYTQSQLQLNISTEFEATFIDGEVDSKNAWASLGETWAENRSVTLDVAGGDPSILSEIALGFGAADSGAFKEWATSVAKNPSEVIYILTSINNVFDVTDPRNESVNQALNVYLNSKISVQADVTYKSGNDDKNTNYSTSSRIYIQGSYAVPTTDKKPSAPINFPLPIGGIQLALWDVEKRDYLLSKTYYLPMDYMNNDPFYKEIYDDVSQFINSKYVIGIAFFGFNAHAFPPSQVSGWLRDCGIKLHDWQQYINSKNVNFSILSFSFVGAYNIPSFIPQQDFLLLENPQNSGSSMIQTTLIVDAE